MPKLSIIVPIYNGEKFLNKCVDSILAQSFTDFEVILVDDGSTDNSLEICRQYEQKDPRVIVHHKNNGGLVSSRKSGLQVSTGKYIGFVDCDDYIDQDMYSELIRTIEKDSSDIAIEGIIFESGDSKKFIYNRIPEGVYDRDSIKKTIIPKMLTYSGFVKFGLIPGVVVKIFRRENLEKAMLFLPNNVSIGDDVALTAHGIINANSISIIRSAAYHYVQLDTSMVHQFDSNRFVKINNLYDCISKIDNKDYNKQIHLYISYLIFDCISATITKSGYSKSKIRKKIQEILSSELARKTLKNADTSQLSKKDKIKIFLMRHKMICLLNHLINPHNK